MKQIKQLALKWTIIYIIIAVTLLALVAMGLTQRTKLTPSAPSLPQTTYRAGQIPAAGKKLLYLTGHSSAQSQAFIAPLAWDVYWDFLCDESASPGYFNVTILDENGSASLQARPIAAQGISGFGDQKYTMAHSETVTLRVASNCHWHLTAKSAGQ